MALSDTVQILHFLQEGEIDQVGLVPWGSNYTFLVRVCHDREELEAIYKPRKGERPLWDFPRGTLCNRERAAFLVGESLGWNIIPPTVLREGPHGFGSVQYFVAHDPDQHYFSLEGDFDEQLQRIALFDSLANNADRKGGHVLLGKNAHLWSIDHGICFHAEPKLRSVIWDFASQPIPADLLTGLEALGAALNQVSVAGDERKRGSLLEELSTLLTRQEVSALRNRARRLLDTGVFPQPGPGRHYPWPPV